MKHWIELFKARLAVRKAKMKFESCAELFIEGTWSTTDVNAINIYNKYKGEYQVALCTLNTI